MKPKIYAGLLFIFNFCLFTAYASTTSGLSQEIKQADAAFFEAFNTCDMNTMAKMFSQGLEFYHDTAGLGDYQSNMVATKTLCEKKLGLERTLVPNTHEIYPIKDFGAVQMGQHTFCHTVNKKEDCGTFGFIHVWKKTDSGWLIHRVISYGH